MIIKKQGKIIGEIKGEVYITWRKQEHFMFKYNGFGISQYLISFLKEQGVNMVIVDYKGDRTRKVFYCPLNQYIYSHKIHLFGEEDVQRFVDINDMEVEEIK